MSPKPRDSKLVVRECSSWKLNVKKRAKGEKERTEGRKNRRVGRRKERKIFVDSPIVNIVSTN